MASQLAICAALAMVKGLGRGGRLLMPHFIPTSAFCLVFGVSSLLLLWLVARGLPFQLPRWGTSVNYGVPAAG